MLNFTPNIKNLHKTNILIAPLDWGLGHTTRCLVIINTLLSNGYNVFFAGNKVQNKLVASNFKNIVFLELKGYNVLYSKNKACLPFKITIQLPKIIFAVIREHYWLQKQIKNYNINLVISDNRFGLFTKKAPCIFITHQLQILVPFYWLELFIQKINYFFINKYNLLLVPDVSDAINAAGKLSHPINKPTVKTLYIGLLNRFLLSNKPNTVSTTMHYDICIILSGPEPQRSILEKMLLKKAETMLHQNIILLRGLPNFANTLQNTQKNLTVFNHLPQQDLFNVLQNSHIIICRSGYTTIMEVLMLQKKLILIPTPGQTEQEYLASHLYNLKLALVVDQNKLDVVNVEEITKNFCPIPFSVSAFNETIFLEEIKRLL